MFDEHSCEIGDSCKFLVSYKDTLHAVDTLASLIHYTIIPLHRGHTHVIADEVDCAISEIKRKIKEALKQ